MSVNLDRNGRLLSLHFAARIVGLLCIALFWTGAVQAQSTHYAYDANGRLVAVTANNGTSAQYSYDALGDLINVGTPIPASQLAIFAFTPTHGEAGAQVLIQGQNFDANAANDTVSFNGVAANVLTATATQLLVAVPGGATTGPISVTASGQTAASATPFVVDDTGLPPSITQVSPAVASVGSTVTVTGAHLNPIADGTTVHMAATQMPLTSISDTQLQYTVPSNISSGFVTVVTPYGTATSAAPEIVLPGSVSATSVVSAGNATLDGANVSLNIGASGQFGAVSFVASQGSWVSLQASAITTTASSISYTVYGPGNVSIQQGAISASSPSIHLPQLTATGSYLVLFQPSGAGAQLAVGVQTDASLTTSVQDAVTTSAAGQSQRVLFNAMAGQSLSFLVTGATTNPSGRVTSYTVYAPNGVTYTSTTTASTGVINLGFLPSSGTYQVVIAPGGGVTAAVQVEIVPAPGGTVIANGIGLGYAAIAPGQNVYLSFNTNAGDNLELTLNNINVAGASNNGFLVSIYAPNGTNVASYSCYASNPGSSCREPLFNLVGGTYTVVVSPTWGGTISFGAILQPDTLGPVLTAGSSVPINLGVGQVDRLTFSANAGDTVALNLSGVSSSLPAGQPVYVTIYAPGQITTTTYGGNNYTTFSTTSSSTLNLPNLPTTGTYTLEVYTSYGTSASAQLTLYSQAKFAVTSNGAPQLSTASVAGQNVYLSINANAGDNLELTLNNINVVGASTNGFQVSIYAPNGTNVASYSCYASSPGASCREPLFNLVGGTYSVVVSPAWGGAISFNAILQPDTLGPVLAEGSPVAVNLGEGQVERVTFNANAGDTVALNLSGASSTLPAGQPVYVTVFAPGQITSSTTGSNYYVTFSATSASTINLANLPTTGTYTLAVYTFYGTPGSAQVALYPGAKYAVASNGTSQSSTANVAGQNVYLSINANAGDNLELTLNNINVVGASTNGFQVSIYAPNGVNVASYSCYASSPGASCREPLFNLVGGTYSVVVSPTWGGTISFNATLQPDILGPVLAVDSPIAVNLGEGQVERVTFNANAGDTVALNLSGTSSTLPSGQPVYVTVFAPGQITASTTGSAYYVTFSATSSSTLNLANLPATGTYTLAVYTFYGTPGSTQLTLYPGAKYAVASNGASQPATANVAGQNVYLSFNTSTGDNLELTLNNVNVVGASTNGFQVNIYAPNGTNVASYSCYASNPGASCREPLFNLVGGTYSVVVSPAWGGTISFGAILQPDTLGPELTAGSSVPINLGVDQVDRLTFNASAGDNVALTLWGVSSTSPVGQPVWVTVYAPGQITSTTYGSNNYSTFNTTSSSTLNLSNLPTTGTYTMEVYTWYGTPASAQLSFSQH